MDLREMKTTIKAMAKYKPERIHFDSDKVFVIVGAMRIEREMKPDANGFSLSFPQLAAFVAGATGESICFESTAGSAVTVRTESASIDLQSEDIDGSFEPTEPRFVGILPNLFASKILRSISKTAGSGDLFLRIDADGAVEVAVTDSVRLAVVSGTMDTAPVSAVTYCLPATVAFVAPLFGSEREIAMAVFRDLRFVLAANGWNVYANMSEKTPINYRAIMPRSLANRAFLPVKETEQALSALLPFAPTNYGKARKGKPAKAGRNTGRMLFESNGGTSLHVTASDEYRDNGPVKLERSIQSETDGTIKHQYNARYILDVLESVSDKQVTWRMNTVNEPSIFDCKTENGLDMRYLLMPINL